LFYAHKLGSYEEISFYGLVLHEKCPNACLQHSEGAKDFLRLLFCFSFSFWVGFQADVETDEVYAQMTLQPLSPVNSSIMNCMIALMVWWKNCY